MIRCAFKKGLRFLEGINQRWTVNKRLVTGKIQLEEDEGEIQNLEIAEINKKWMAGEFVIDQKSLGSGSNVFYLATPRDLNTFGKHDQEIAKYRHQYLMKLENWEGGWVSSPEKLQPILNKIALELGHPEAPKANTVNSWWRKYRLTKCSTKLVDLRYRAGRKSDPVIRSIFEDAISEVYLTEQKDQGMAVIDAIHRKVKNANRELPAEEHLKVPSNATVYRWLKDLHQSLVVRARLGKEAAEKEFRAALKKLKISRILERIEIDHTPLDLIAIDKATMLPLGRPWVTLAIDRYSRMIVGFYICFHAPSSLSVLQCLRQAMLPKDALLARFPEIKGVWPARGIPEMIACDNGMDLHCDAFEQICLEMGIEILYCPAGIPEMKGAIERMFRTLNTGLIHRLPGTVFSNIDQRGDYPSEELAVIDLDTLTLLITKWIVEVYHRRKHRGIGMAPLTKWIEGEQQRIIEMPAYPQQLDVLVGLPVTRTLWHYGIEWDCIRYNSPELQLLRARVGGYPMVNFKCYEHDVGYIHVYDDINQEYIKVPAIDSEYANGLSQHLHHLIREYTKKKYGNEYSDDEIRQSKFEIQAIVGEAVKSKKMAIRKKAAVANAANSEAVFDSENELTKAMNPGQLPNDAEAELLDSGLDDDLPDFGVSYRTGPEG